MADFHVDTDPVQPGWFVYRRITTATREKISGPWDSKLEAETRMVALKNPKVSPALRTALCSVTHGYVLPEPAYYVVMDSKKRLRLRRTKVDFATALYTRKQVEEMLDAAYGKQNAQGT